MRLIFSVLLAVSSVFAYQVIFPNTSQGWSTIGPNFLKWQHVNTDPPNFTVFLTNQNTGYNEILDSNIDGLMASFKCSKPRGGWPSGPNFRVNLAQDPDHPNSLLAQSDDFDITAVSSTSASIQTVTSATATTATASVTGVSSSDTSTTPTGTSAASFSADARSGLLVAVAAFTTLFATLL